MSIKYFSLLIFVLKILTELFPDFTDLVSVMWNTVFLFFFAAKRPPLGTDLSKGGGAVYEGFVRVSE